MRTNFDYIDDVVNDVCERELRAPTVQRDGLRAQATKSIAGFHIYDEAEEIRLVEEAMEKQRTEVTRFQGHRNEVAERCAAVGVKPLAVVPVQAWRQICHDTGLYRLSPDSHGRVGYSQGAFADFNDKHKEKQAEWLAANDHSAYIKRLFPKLESIEGERYNNCRATLVMPIPPADVAAILLKVQSLKLKVATVSEAIAFKETASQLARNIIAGQEAEARARELARQDPIVYHEHELATAILCQFGDFPIERETVDRVVKSEDLLRWFPEQIQSYGSGGGGGLRPMTAQELMQYQQMLAMQNISVASAAAPAALVRSFRLKFSAAAPRRRRFVRCVMRSSFPQQQGGQHGQR